MSNGRARQAGFASAFSLIGAAAVLLIVNAAVYKPAEDVSVHYMLEQMEQVPKARFQELWFGPGISDELNRMVKMGKHVVIYFREPQVRRFSMS